MLFIWNKTQLGKENVWAEGWRHTWGLRFFLPGREGGYTEGEKLTSPILGWGAALGRSTPTSQATPRGSSPGFQNSVLGKKGCRVNSPQNC